MRVLLHAPFDPGSRAVRLALREKQLDFNLVEQVRPEDDGDFLRINPAGSLPVLLEQSLTGEEAALTPARAAAEYLDEAYGGTALLPGTSLRRAETRRLCAWFEEKFRAEVSGPIMVERIEKRLRRLGPPDYAVVRPAVEAAAWHLDYVNHLVETRNWIAGETLTLADLFAAAHLSVLDYFGVVRWPDAPFAKDWYQRVKSRPSFRPLLEDRLAGTQPHRTYADLDF
ncbi:MAG: glutathione S-transferase family protein [Pseudomonadota bacterium]